MRAVTLDGATNFRDLGGYATIGGRQVQRGRLFRADQLADLSTRDRGKLDALGIARSLDFRGHGESAQQGYDWPGLKRIALPIEPTVVQSIRAILEAGGELTAAQTTELMCDTYRHFARDCTAQFASVFQYLLDDGPTLVFHCTAGKDRTGFAAALVLHALGVPLQTIFQDYLLTNSLYRMPTQSVSSGLVSDDVLRVLWRVQPEFLRAALELIDRDFGGMDNYLADELGVGRPERRELAARYLAT